MIFSKKLMSGILALSAIAMLSGCESNQQRQAKEQQKTEQMKRNGDDESLPSGNYFEQDDQHKTVVAQQKHALNNVAQQMNHNYRKLGITKYNQDYNQIVLYLQGKQSQQIIKYLKANDKQANKFWNQLTSGLKKSSSSISKQTKDYKLIFAIKALNNTSLYKVQNGHQILNKY